MPHNEDLEKSVTNWERKYLHPWVLSCEEEFLQKDAKDEFVFGEGGKCASVLVEVAHKEECGAVKWRGRKGVEQAVP